MVPVLEPGLLAVTEKEAKAEKEAAAREAEALKRIPE